MGGGKTMERELIKRKKRGFLWRDESGQVLVLVALAAAFLIGMAALVVDIGHGFVVRQELQNAADASALAGAGNLLPLIGTFPTATPNYLVAKQKAIESIQWNKAGFGDQRGHLSPKFKGYRSIPPSMYH